MNGIILLGRVVIVALVILAVFGIGHWAELALNLEGVE